MDIENSPGALAGRHEPAARDIMGQRFVSDGAMCGNCLCCTCRRDPRRERRAATLFTEHGVGVLWHHAASTLRTAVPSERGSHPAEGTGGQLRLALRPLARNHLAGQKIAG